jgi:hypothetical protein
MQKTAKGQELVDGICQHLSLLEKDYFSCTFRDIADIKVCLRYETGVSE